jgi:hypothetical protein
VIAGAVLIGLSIVVGVAGTALTVGRFDLAQFERDVVVSGPDSALLPGELEFRVTESLDRDRDASMTVGVAVAPSAAADPDCTLRTAGAPGGSDPGPAGDVPLRSVAAGTELLRPTAEDARVVSQAELAPGDYVLSCRPAGEPGAGAGGSISVGRVFGTDDALGLVGPALAFLAAGAVSVVAFLVGVGLLIAGLVRGRRSAAVGGPGPPGPPGQR